MEHIHEPNGEFSFESIETISPKSIQSGNYLIKFHMKHKPLYIRPPKCRTKGGITKTSKKIHCDLLFSNQDDEFIQWIENLENYCRSILFANKESWFDTELEMNDIEDSFSSPLKMYKSGKNYLLRTNISSILGKPSLKIYNEYENEMNYSDVKEGSEILTIIEIQGIKCSPRSFQIEIDLKQILILQPDNLFEKCILGGGKEVKPIEESKPIEVIKPQPEESTSEEPTSKEPEEPEEPEKTEEPEIEEITDFSRLENHLEENNPLLEEVEIDLEQIENTEPIPLKTKKDIYYKMYNDARQKAKLARDLAISSYLEAKNIKSTYGLNDLDSDSDTDEIF
jgi:hypothetical protein